MADRILVVKEDGSEAQVELRATSDGKLLVSSSDGASTVSSASQADYSIDNIDDTTTADTVYYTFYDSTDNWYVLREVNGSTFGYATVTNNAALTTKALFLAEDITTLTYGTKGDAF